VTEKRGHKSPKGYEATDYPSFAVTVDVVILTMVDSRLHVLLVKRRDDPYQGQWALPGGFKRPEETLDQAAFRELRDETGVTAPARLAQFGAYGDPGRDPRTNVVTVGYLAVAPEVGAILAGSDADEAQLWPVAQAVRELGLAFDHQRILADAINRAAEQLEQTDLATAFVGDTFTLSELQGVYEELWDTDIDAANFRRSLGAPAGKKRLPAAPAAAAMSAPARAAEAPSPDIAALRMSPEESIGAVDEDESYVTPTGERAKPSDKGGRPPELFKKGGAWKDEPPLRRPRGSKRRSRND
jgi:8-oxo-dGTP diphosphatase